MIRDEETRSLALADLHVESSKREKKKNNLVLDLPACNGVVTVQVTISISSFQQDHRKTLSFVHIHRG